MELQRKNLTIEGSNGKWAQMHLWDTLGQEKFKFLSPIFFRRSVGALLVYDVTSRESFLALEGWRKQIDNTATGTIVVMLIGNKVDLPGKVITSEMGAEYARSNGMGFMEVSAKSDLNIDAAFRSLIQNIYQSTTAASGQMVLELD